MKLLGEFMKLLQSLLEGFPEQFLRKIPGQLLKKRRKFWIKTSGIFSSTAGRISGRVSTGISGRILLATFRKLQRILPTISWWNMWKNSRKKFLENFQKNFRRNFQKNSREKYWKKSKWTFEAVLEKLIEISLKFTKLLPEELFEKLSRENFLKNPRSNYRKDFQRSLNNRLLEEEFSWKHPECFLEDLSQEYKMKYWKEFAENFREKFWKIFWRNSRSNF